MKSELKPCMKCGSDAVKLDYRWDSITLSKSYFVYCVNCDTYFYGNCARDSTIVKWNIRPAEDALKAEVESLKEALSDMCALWEALGASVPPVLNEQKYLNAKTLLTKGTPKKGRQEDSGNGCCSFFEPKVITNGDRIRQMSNGELADYLSDSDVEACAKDRDHCKEEHWNCRNCWFEYLESEVKK